MTNPKYATDHGFHTHSGLYFKRLEDGSVRIFQDGHGFELDLDPGSWASVISSVSKGGESDGRYYAARTFHDSEGEIRIEAAIPSSAGNLDMASER